MKQYILKKIARNKFNTVADFDAAFEDALNNPPKGYDINNYFYNSIVYGSNDDKFASAYRIVYKRIPEAITPITTGRKFKIDEPKV